jgi:hypothetical protein
VKRLVFVLVMLVAALPAAQAPKAADILKKAGEYLAEYEKQFSAVVSEEHYEQTTTRRSGVLSNARKRQLKSDVVLITSSQTSWLAFRDVFEVDGKPVRDRDERLQKLFLETPNQAIVNAQRIMAESARYNIGSLQRNVNVPTMALIFLRADNQRRSTFTMGGTDRIKGVETREFSFKETASPTVIRSGATPPPPPPSGAAVAWSSGGQVSVGAQDLFATGKFWIEAATGRVVKSEIQVKGTISTTKITVTYGPAPKLTIWAPIEMEESYKLVMNNETISGDAKYSNFRQFKVTVSENIK